MAANRNYMQALRKITQWFVNGAVTDPGTPENMQDVLDNLVNTLESTSQITTLGDGAVTTAKLANLGTTTAKIDNLAVTTGKLANEAVDGTKIPAGAFRILEFVGSNLTGDCTATGVKIGDKIVAVVPLTTPAAGNSSALFEATATKNDKIVQTSNTDLSTKTYLAFILARS